MRFLLIFLLCTPCFGQVWEEVDAGGSHETLSYAVCEVKTGSTVNGSDGPKTERLWGLLDNSGWAIVDAGTPSMRVDISTYATCRVVNAELKGNWDVVKVLKFRPAQKLDFKLHTQAEVITNTPNVTAYAEGVTYGHIRRRIKNISAHEHIARVDFRFSGSQPSATTVPADWDYHCRAEWGDTYVQVEYDHGIDKFKITEHLRDSNGNWIDYNPNLPGVQSTKTWESDTVPTYMYRSYKKVLPNGTIDGKIIVGNGSTGNPNHFSASKAGTQGTTGLATSRDDSFNGSVHMWINEVVWPD